MNIAKRMATFSFFLIGTMAVAASFAQSPDDNRRVCKREATTSTRMPAPRICRTVAQWRDAETRLDREQEDRDGEVLRPERLMSEPKSPATPAATPQ